MDSARLNLFLNVITLILGAGGLGIILKYRLGTKKLDLDSEEAIRDHYAKEVARLTEKLESETQGFRATMRDMEEHYRRMLSDSDRRHEECQRDREALRQEVSNMHDEIRGLKRQIARYSADALVILEDRGCPSDAAPHAASSAARVKRKTESK